MEDVAGSRAGGITPILLQRPGNETDLDTLDFKSDNPASGSASVRVESNVITIGDLRELLVLFE